MSSSLLHWETSDFPNGKAQFSWELRGRAPSRCYHCLLVCQDWFSDQCELGLFRKGINLRLFRLRYKRGAKGIRLKKTRKLETAEFELKAGRVALSVPRAWGWYFQITPLFWPLLFIISVYICSVEDNFQLVKLGLSWVAHSWQHGLPSSSGPWSSDEKW